MKRILSLIVFALFSSFVSAQHMSVEEFRYLENDLSARAAKVEDINNELCALIRLNTPERGFEFAGCNVEKTEQKTGEIWVFVSPGVKFITIKHRDFGAIINYPFPERINSGCVYEMKLRTARIKQIVEENITNQYLIIKSNTPDANIFINDEYLGKQSVMKYLPLFQEHNYRVEAPLYHSKSGNVKLNAEEKTTLQVDLDPAFGYLKVNTSPVSGAMVEINGKTQSQTTPFKSDKLESGKYEVRALKTMYKSDAVKVDIRDGKTTEININLIPTFAETEIACEDSDASIYIDGEFKGKGGFKERLSEGTHRLEIKKANHRTFAKNINVVSGRDFKENVSKLEAINGRLNISSTPFEADIYIDGKLYGQTPMLIPQLLIGEHIVEIKKEGYKDLQEIITIEEGKIAEKSFVLQEVASVMLTSEPSNANIEINGTNFGFTPMKINSLEEGTYNLKLSKSGYKDITEVINLKKGVNPPLSYYLQSSDKCLNITSYPSGASIYLDDSYKGLTPANLKNIEAGKYDLELRKAGYKNLSEKIKVKGEPHEYYSFSLEEKKQINWKSPEDCFFALTGDIAYAGSFMYGASAYAQWLIEVGNDISIPVLQAGVSYFKGNKYKDNIFMMMMGYGGVRMVFSLREEAFIMNFGYGLAYKRLMFYADIGYYEFDYGYSYTYSRYQDGVSFNLGVGFCF